MKARVCYKLAKINLITAENRDLAHSIYTDSGKIKLEEEQLSSQLKFFVNTDVSLPVEDPALQFIC